MIIQSGTIYICEQCSKKHLDRKEARLCERRCSQMLGRHDMPRLLCKKIDELCDGDVVAYSKIVGLDRTTVSKMIRGVCPVSPKALGKEEGGGNHDQ